MTTNVERKELPDGWKWVKLGDVCVGYKNTNPRRRPNTKFTYVDISSIDRITKSITNPRVMDGRDAPSRARRMIITGDVLVSTTRPNLNAVAIVDDRLDGQICSTGLCVLRSKGSLVIPHWLYYCAISERFVNSLSDLVSGAMYPAVTDKQVFEQVIPLPPLSEQKRIVAVLDDRIGSVEKARRAAEEMLEAVGTLRGAILRELLP